MIDAAWVTSNLRIDQDGNISGLLNQNQIDQDHDKYFISDVVTFLDFIKINLNTVISAKFGVIFALIDLQFSPFSIACLPSTLGKDTLDLVGIFELNILQLPKKYIYCPSWNR